MLPYLNLDYRISYENAEDYQLVFKQTIYEILLQHIGGIVKFKLSVPGKTPQRDVDKWILYVIRNGVKELTLGMWHTLPSYVFNCPTLTHLYLTSCCFKPPNSFAGFQKLTTLYLKGITFAPTTEFCIIDAPLLVSLEVIECPGTQYLRIVSPQLEKLGIFWIDHLLLNCFLNCQNLREFCIRDDVVDTSDDQKHGKTTTLEKLLFSSAPTLENLDLDSIFLELFSADIYPKGAPFTLNSLCYLLLLVDFSKVTLVSGALQLIKGSPNLSKLHILVELPGQTHSNLNTLAYLDQPLNKLKHVIMDGFKGSSAELLFVKQLFACTPSLLRMRIEPDRAFGTTEEKNMMAELMRFPRASPKAELYYVLCNS